MNRIVILVKGGLVSDVLSDGPAEVLVLDMDTEGADEEEIMRLWDYEAAPSCFEAAIHPSLVDEAYDVYEERFSGVSGQDRESYSDDRESYYPEGRAL